MASKLTRRIERLAQQAQAFSRWRGCRYFTHLGEVYAPGQYAEGDWSAPPPDARLWSEAEIGELRAEGWYIIQLIR